MSVLPEEPFLTDDFSPKGGGIDFLGLRYVNLYLVGNYLIPELNNVTRDMGTFLLGAWIPWKFHQIARQGQFTARYYQAFREKVEVAISFNMRDASPAAQQKLSTRTRVGVTQDCLLPCALSFKAAKRSKGNSLYAAAIYGPSLRALDLIDSYSVLAKNGMHLPIATASMSSDTQTLMQTVDNSLRAAKAYEKLASLANEDFSEEDVNELGLAGLAPGCYRAERFDQLKAIFRNKLLPSSPQSLGFARTQTACLLLSTLHANNGRLSSSMIRNAWYTGMFSDGTMLSIENDGLRNMQSMWSLFMARQYQRYAIELFLWCFETALLEGCCSINDIVQYWMGRSKASGHILESTFRDVLLSVAGDLCGNSDLETSIVWNRSVHANHARFEHVLEPQGDQACIHGLHMFAGWYWRMHFREESEQCKPLMQLGGNDRMGMSWFINWLQIRQNMTLPDLLKDIFSDLIFSQHTRVALSRFDGNAQRLRFVLGDGGIEPTVSAKASLGKLGLPWMPDRLDTLIDLLHDVEILNRHDDGRLSPGTQAAQLLDKYQ